MGLFALSNLAGAGINTLSSMYTANKNYEAQKEAIEANRQNIAVTNKTNLQAVRETNASNVEQANIAYQRSLPTQQVSDMMNAGISKYAAMSKLAGGGVYSPPALAAAQAQSFQQNAPQLDLSQVAQAFDRLSSIPQNVEQYKMVKQQVADLKQEYHIKQMQELRNQERHDYEMWRLRYDKKTAELLDGVASKVVQTAADKGYDLSSAKSVQSIMRDLGLEKDKDYLQMPNMARVDLFDAIRTQNDQRMAQENHSNEMRAANDTHDLSSLDKLLKKTDLSEKQQSLVYKLGILANQLDQSNLVLDKENFEKVIRDAGFANKKEAAEAIAACENLEAMTRRNKSRFISVRSDSPTSHLGYGVEWLIDKINPLKGFLSSK